tara:strand:- start:719 stop:1090 length:372 start_codon:yes stop_codon:yes gene_type:complete
MKITTLENGDRQLELTQYERDTLIEVSTYLRDHYDDLEFSIRNFTLDQVNQVKSFLENFDVSKPNHFTEKKIRLIDRVFAETCNLVDSKILEEKEEWDDVSYNLNNLFFDNLQIKKIIEQSQT